MDRRVNENEIHERARLNGIRELFVAAPSKCPRRGEDVTTWKSSIKSHTHTHVLRYRTITIVHWRCTRNVHTRAQSCEYIISVDEMYGRRPRRGTGGKKLFSVRYACTSRRTTRKTGPETDNRRLRVYDLHAYVCRRVLF